VVMA